MEGHPSISEPINIMTTLCFNKSQITFHKGENNQIHVHKD